MHDYFVLGIIEAGLQTFSYRGAQHATAPSGIIVLNPDEPQTGEAATPEGFVYKALYPSADLMQFVATEMVGRSTAMPFFTAPVIYDANLARRILSKRFVGVTPAQYAKERKITQDIAPHHALPSL